ncbi:hypothetical protein GUITHDRAFT_119476, partial [Guillardia theta CCMP2712]
MVSLEHLIVAVPASGHQFLPGQRVVLVLLFALDAFQRQPDIHRVDVSLNFYVYNFSVEIDRHEISSNPACVLILPELPSGTYVLHAFLTNHERRVVSLVKSSMFEVVSEGRENDARNVA